MNSRMIQIVIDDRVRLMSAALSLTNWPAREQERKRHRAHVHARNTAKRVMEFANMPVMHSLQTLLDQNTPLEALYTYALNLSWPDLTPTIPLPWAPLHWNEQFGDFYVKAGLADWWAEQEEAWQLAYEQTERAIGETDFYGFFEPFVGEISEQLTLMPNISYPSDCEIGVRLDEELFCVVPPRIAWGDNEPWPFDDDPAHVYRGTLAQYGRLVMVSYLRQKAAEVAPLANAPLPVGENYRKTHPTWGDQFTDLFVAGAVAIFLEQTIGPHEAKAYILMENKVHGVTILPGVVSVLKRYLAEQEEGRYEQLSDYLPNFSKHLRVAKRVISL
jgi:hypothetical protein